LKYFVGCAGWRYGNWVSGFYRSALDPRDCLAYYSMIFDLVAISVEAASAYALGGWARETSDDFRFIARVPKQATDRDLVRKFLRACSNRRKGAYSGAAGTAVAYSYRRKGVA
jgi:uncharacterized protein YecE (DUF72 family)